MSKKRNEKFKIGISCGDMNGVGMEVIMKTFMDPRMFDFCIPIVYGSMKAANFYRKKLNYNDFSFHQIDSPEKAHAKKLNFIQVGDDSLFVDFGKSSKEAGELAFTALEKATEDLAANYTDILVTAPINKHNMQSDKFNFPGHTEYLANYANEENPIMLLCHDELRVGIVTGHIPLKEVSNVLTEELILKKLSVFHKSLTQDFLINRPKIAVLGLNPHAGDNGVIGNEEIDIIIPAIEKAQNEGIYAFGPFPADGFFGSSQFKQFDGVLGMYHDQALAPFKALSFDAGVNYTAGLPIVRTSPDHGTGYGIAGKGLASEGSFRHAVYLAYDIFSNRKLHREVSADPLVSNPRHEKNHH